MYKHPLLRILYIALCVVPASVWAQPADSTAAPYQFDPEEKQTKAKAALVFEREAFASPNRVTGHILDASEQPVAGAELIVFTPDEVICKVVTNAKGEYEINNLIAGDYDIVIKTTTGRNFAMYRVWFASDTQDAVTDFQINLGTGKGVSRPHKRLKEEFQDH
jgi:hypothetical protein